MPGVFADILNSLTLDQPNRTPVQRLDEAGARAITGARQGADDLQALLRKLILENFGGPVGPGGSPTNFVGPVQPAPPPQPNLLQRLFGL